MKFQLSIRGAFYLTTAVAVYSAILALAYRGNIWGKGITFAVTCSFLVWFASAFLYWAFFLVLKVLGIEERNRGTMHSSGVQTANPIKPNPSIADLTGLVERETVDSQPDQREEGE